MNDWLRSTFDRGVNGKFEFEESCIYHDGWMKKLHTKHYFVLYKQIREETEYLNQSESIVGLYWFKKAPLAKDNNKMVFSADDWEGVLPIGRDPSFKSVDGKNADKRFLLIVCYDIEGELNSRKIILGVEERR